MSRKRKRGDMDGSSEEDDDEEQTLFPADQEAAIEVCKTLPDAFLMLMTVTFDLGALIAQEQLAVSAHSGERPVDGCGRLDFESDGVLGVDDEYDGDGEGNDGPESEDDGDDRSTGADQKGKGRAVPIVPIVPHGQSIVVEVCLSSLSLYYNLLTAMIH